MQNQNSNLYGRREFLKKLAVAGPAVYLGMGGIFTLAKSALNLNLNDPEFTYKYKTVSVKHVKEVGDWFAKLKAEKRISDNKIFRGYIDNFVYDPEKVMPGAKSIIIVSVPFGSASVIFRKNGKKYKVIVPFEYWDNGLNYPKLKERVFNDLVKNSSEKMQGQIRLPIKTLAARSGLAEYGKNNITYVDEYGSFQQLIGYYTTKEMPDNWEPLKTLRLCKGCSICVNACPTKCFREDNFVIDIGKCITLYNELPDPMPEWINPKAHNVLAGCYACQWECPANKERKKDIKNIADMTEEETEFILKAGTDKKMREKIAEKLKLYPSVADFEYFSRNLKLVLNNIEPMSGK